MVNRGYFLTTWNLNDYKMFHQKIRIDGIMCFGYKLIVKNTKGFGVSIQKFSLHVMRPGNLANSNITSSDVSAFRYVEGAR